MTSTSITIEASILAPVEKVWQYFTGAEHIVQWNTASEDWHTTKAENDLRVDGKFSSRMEAKDGSFGFDFWGIYTTVNINNEIAYTLGDERKVRIKFSTDGNVTNIIETFDAEQTNPIELQKDGWQAILNNFKKYTESN